MLFNSIDFALFLPVVFFLYWGLSKSNLKIRNLLVVAASYFFYGCWDWRFLSLILFSTLVDYTVGVGMTKTDVALKRKILLWISIVVNIGLLTYFKYYNFFVDNFVAAFSLFGAQIKPNSLHIILPVGISFYTFQTLSYSIDVYKRKLEPTKDFIAFAAFVSFFPQLVAGPIERATHLLPQFYTNRSFDYSKAVDGMRQILWGLFKKVVIADNCAEYANMIFNNSTDYSSSTLALGALFFAFQIYGDFSGYSDIAIGTARLFGFDIMRNFAFPYFSRDIAEFWRRWHISLSTWFRDYLYIPLGGSRGGNRMKLRNTFIIFLVSGFWHGANWTFVIWGFLNALYFVPLLLSGKNRNHMEIVAKGKTFPALREFLQMILTFGLTVFAWIFFRAENPEHAFQYIGGLFSHPGTYFSLQVYFNYAAILLLILLFLVIEWVGREHQHALQNLGLKWNKYLRYASYYALILLILWYSGKEQQFIYFQF